LKSPASNLKNSKIGSPFASTRSRPNKQVTISEKSNTFFEEPKILAKSNQNRSFRSPDANTTDRDLLQKLGQSSSSGRILNDFAFTPTPLYNNHSKLQTPQSNLRYRETFSVPNSTKNSTFMRSERPQTPTLQQSPMKIGIPQPSRLVNYFF